jgi:hypothetical protein
VYRRELFWAGQIVGGILMTDSIFLFRLKFCLLPIRRRVYCSFDLRGRKGGGMNCSAVVIREFGRRENGSV